MVPKFSYFGLFVRLFSEILNTFGEVYIKFIFIGVCITSLIVGSVAALIQKKIKPLAYSSIANIGFILIGFSSSSVEGFSSSLIYFIIYNLILVSLFYLLLSIKYLHNNLSIKNVNEFFGLLNENFIYCLFFLISLFSLIGLPPLAGFIGKLYLFLIALLSNLEILFLVAVYASILSTIVYLKIIRTLFFNKNILFFSYKIDSTKTPVFLVIIFLFNVYFFLFPTYFFYYIYNLNFNLLFF